MFEKKEIYVHLKCYGIDGDVLRLVTFSDW
jgi:hypothetical protein